MANPDTVSKAGLKRYFANTSWLLLERILRIVIVLIVSVYLARFLGPESYGLLTYATSIAAIFLALSNLGLNDVLIKELREDPAHHGNTLGTGLFLISVGCIVAFIGIVITSLVIEDRISASLVFIISFSALFRTSSLFECYFQSRVEGKYISITNAAQLFLGAMVKLYLIWIHAPLHWFAWAIMLDYLLVFIFLGITFLNTGNSWCNWRVEPVKAKSLLSLSWPLLLSGVFVTIYMRIDQVMIKHFMDSQSVGQYAVAVQISETWYFIPMLISASVFPSILNLKSNNEATYYRRLQALYRLMCGIGFIAAVVASFFGEWMIITLFGTEYAQAVPVLQIHIWAGIFVALGVASSKWFIAENLNRHLFYRSFWGCLLNIVLNALLIPIWGINGAAVATLFSHAVSAFIYDAFVPSARTTFMMKIKALLLPIPVRI